jgi:hypothetical protein
MPTFFSIHLLPIRLRYQPSTLYLAFIKYLLWKKPSVWQHWRFRRRTECTYRIREKYSTQLMRSLCSRNTSLALSPHELTYHPGGRDCALPVSIIHQGERIEPAHIYVIPKDVELTIQGGLTRYRWNQRSGTYSSGKR